MVSLRISLSSLELISITKLNVEVHLHILLWFHVLHEKKKSDYQIIIPLKTSRKQEISYCLQGVWKETINMK